MHFGTIASYMEKARADTEDYRRGARGKRSDSPVLYQANSLTFLPLLVRQHDHSMMPTDVGDE